MSMNPTYEDYKKVATETSQDTMAFFKLETAIANVPVTQFLISSLYRSILMNSTKAKNVTPNADDLFSVLYEDEVTLPSYFTNLEFHDLLNGSLNIPKGASKNKEQYLISPLIPEIASFGGNMRRGSSWNSGGYILQIIANSSRDKEQFLSVIKDLFNSLSANSKNNDLIWTEFLKQEFKAVGISLSKAVNRPIETDVKNFEDVKESLVTDVWNKIKKSVYHESTFSKTVIEDLKSLCQIESQNKVTRQQWIGLLESYFRLLIFNHSINTLNQSRSYFSILLKILDSDRLNEMSEVCYYDFINASPIQNSNTNRLLNISSRSSDYVNDNIHMYCLYNHFIYHLFEEFDIEYFTKETSKEKIIETSNFLLGELKTSGRLRSFYSEYRRENEHLINKISVKSDRQLAQISECLIYISQKKVLPKDLKSYIPDVNYLFSRRKGVIGNPYMFDLGSGTISLLTALIFKKKTDVNFLSGLDYIAALLDYNIELSITDISSGNIKNIMQSLGIIIDSPDTEGGVLIVKPGWI